MSCGVLLLLRFCLQFCLCLFLKYVIMLPVMSGVFDTMAPGALEGKHDILLGSQQYPIKVVVGFTQHIPCFFFALNGLSTTN